MKKVKASFTVEAVFVMPIVLFTMVFIIYLSFYLHDYSRIQSVTDSVLHKAILYHKHGADIATGRVNYEEINQGLVSRIFNKSGTTAADVEAYLRKRLSDCFLATEIKEVRVTKGVLSISARVEGKFKCPFRGVLKMLSFDKSLVFEAKSAYHNPAESVRISEVILDTGSRVKGFDDELKEKLGKLLPD